MRIRIPVLLLCLVATSCAERRPDLTRVYPDATLAPRRPVIIIPGVFGSRLKNERTGEVVWGRFSNFLKSRFQLALNFSVDEGDDLLDLPIDSTDMTANHDSLRAYGLFDAVAGRGFYKRIVRTLVSVAGYRFGDIANPQPGEDCFAFYYDWRRDVVENAHMLGQAIARVRAACTVSGAPPPKVDLIAHSMGGLIARYYLKYGARDVLEEHDPEVDHAGARDIDTVVMIGVPNEGTLDSFASHNNGVRIARPLPPEAIFTMPSAYQTMPRVRVKPFIDTSGRTLDIDLYESSNWEKYGWSVFAPDRLHRLHEELVDAFGAEEGERRYLKRLTGMRAFHAAALARASRLNDAMDRRGRAEEGVRYFAFGGDCIPTAARAMIIEQEDGSFRTVIRFADLPKRLATAEIERLMTEPGDGTVTRSSHLATHSGQSPADPESGLHLDYSLFLCATHRSLTENVTFQDNLLQFLLYRR